MKTLVNGSNFAVNSSFIFSEIVSRSNFEKLIKVNPNLIIVREFNYLKLDAIWYINPILRLKENDIIFCHTEVVELLFKSLKNFSQLNNLKLITHLSDRTINKKLFLKKNKNIKKWFSTNINHIDINLIPIPIGLNNFYNENNFDNKIQNTFFKDFKKSSKVNRIFVNFTLNTNKKHRSKALQYVQKLDKEKILIESDTSSFKYYENLAKSKYTLAPWGNGIDTHRFWEALYLGSCPITLEHTHYKQFENLPGIFLKNYKEISIENLEQQYLKFQNAKFEILDINYWFTKINEDKIKETNIFEFDDSKLINENLKILKLKFKFLSLKKIAIYNLKKYFSPKNYFRFFNNK